MVGSADYRHQSGFGTYEFGISLDAGIPAPGVRRTVELNDNPGVNDQNVIEVGSTAFFTVSPGLHTFRLRGRGAGNAHSEDASMTINCFERRLTGFINDDFEIPAEIE